MAHICHIATTFNLRSGSGRRTISILRACLEHGYKVSLIVGRDHDITPEDLPHVNLYVVPELVKHISLRRDIAALWKIRALLKRIKPDVVHTHLAKAGIVGRVAAAGGAVPWILHTVHGPTFPRHFNPVKRFIFKSLERFCSSFTDLFVFVGRELREEYIGAGICSISSSVVIYTGRPDTVFDRLPMNHDRRLMLRGELCGGQNVDFLIVTVGRIVPSKQIDHSIMIVERLRRQGIPASLAVVGKCLLESEKQCEEKLFELAADLSVCDWVYFTGFRDDVLDVMEAADVVTLTSSYEGLPNVAVEAMISGTPMVTYKVAGVSELLRPGIDGWIVGDDDIDLMTDKIKDLYNGSVLGPNKERAAVLGDFRESAMVSAKMELYDKILHDKLRNENR